MKREDCWMTFTEALEAYLRARDFRNSTVSKRIKEEHQEKMDEAAEHLDALTGNEA